ncbi:hypothetical protein E2C01_029328 [Portunus trituberculatus]|uniref:Uncharacterized protein n=1 Tax=Portunus trituberculatus TaxID=210409 RepID=A0A5B7EN67_PORTR|nr:hypothetical protein [Portunus trituberculatus]
MACLAPPDACTADGRRESPGRGNDIPLQELPPRIPPKDSSSLAWQQSPRRVLSSIIIYKAEIRTLAHCCDSWSYEKETVGHGVHTRGDAGVQLESRQGLAAGDSPSLQPLWTQLLQRQNPHIFPSQLQSLNIPGLSLQSQGLPFSSLQNTFGSQTLASPLHTLRNQGLLGSPFSPLGAGLSGTQLLANPGLLGMLPTVNRLGRLGASSQLRGGQLGIVPSGLALHPLLAQSPARQDNLAPLLGLASLLSDEPGAHRHSPHTPNTRIQLTGSFSHRPHLPHYPHPLHRLLSLPTGTQGRLGEILDGRSPASLADRANLGNGVSRFGSPQATEFNRPPLPLSHTSQTEQPPALPLATATHRPTHNDGFRFPSK